MTHKTAPPSLRRLFPLFLIIIIIPLLGCNLLNRIGGGGDVVDDAAGDEMSLEEALEVTPLDSRPTVIEEMGPPDAFSITFSELEGETVRWESWSYFDLTSQFDFIDGELIWAIDLEPVVDGSFYAHWYNPLDFRAGMSVTEVTALFPDIKFGEIDTTALDVEGSLALAGEQILLGFDNDKLVYVETFILSPGTDSTQVDGTDAGALPDPTPSNEASTDEDGEDMLSFLQDKFEAESPIAVPIATDDFMTLNHVNGLGELTTFYEQSLMLAMYEEFTLDDFILDVDIQFPDPSTGAKAGVVFRGEDPDDALTHYYLVMLAPQEEKLVLATFNQTEWLRWDLVDIPADLLSSSHAYHLGIDCLDDRIAVSLGGVEVVSINDSANPDPGFFGIAVAAYEVPETAFFDNLFIIEHP